MARIRVFNIEYDTDGDERVKRFLPKELVFDECDEEELADKISDHTGYLVYDFEQERITDSDVKNNRFKGDYDELKIGLGVTEILFSDKHPYEIIAIKDDRHITIRALDSKRTDNNGMSDSQTYDYFSNVNNPTKELFKTQKGVWRERKGKKLGTIVYYVGKAEEYYDFSF